MSNGRARTPSTPANGGGGEDAAGAAAAADTDVGSVAARTRGRSRGRSVVRRGGNEVVIHERVVQERTNYGNSIVYPTLTATNYIEWALVMKINLRAQGLWEAVSGMGVAGDREDMAALSALLRAVPPEMVPVLAVKDTAADAWEAIKLMRMGVSRAREATAQRLRKEFEQIAFKDLPDRFPSVLSRDFRKDAGEYQDPDNLFAMYLLYNLARFAVRVDGATKLLEFAEHKTAMSYPEASKLAAASAKADAEGYRRGPLFGSKGKRIAAAPD
jgi:hypothetical protein